MRPYPKKYLQPPGERQTRRGAARNCFDFGFALQTYTHYTTKSSDEKERNYCLRYRNALSMHNCSVQSHAAPVIQFQLEASAYSKFTENDAVPS